MTKVHPGFDVNRLINQKLLMINNKVSSPLGFENTPDVEVYGPVRYDFRDCGIKRIDVYYKITIESYVVDASDIPPWCNDPDTWNTIGNLVTTVSGIPFRWRVYNEYDSDILEFEEESSVEGYILNKLRTSVLNGCTHVN